MSEKAKGKAYFVRDLKNFKGKAKLFRVDPDYETNTGKFVEYVIVVACPTNEAGEDYVALLPSGVEGRIEGWNQLNCRVPGRSYGKSLANAGYRIVVDGDDE